MSFHSLSTEVSSKTTFHKSFLKDWKQIDFEFDKRVDIVKEIEFGGI